MNLARIYGRAFFEEQAQWRADYAAMAEILARRLQFSSVLDIGCGNALLLTRLHEVGKRVRGVDGSLAALAAAPGAVRRFLTLHDLRQPLRLPRRDLVVCMEVGEHLEAAFADTLVASVCGCSRGLVLFSAATPGQGGVHHINEQPHDYWLEEFGRHGFRLCERLTASLHKELSSAIHGAWWFTRNAMVLRGEATTFASACRRRRRQRIGPTKPPGRAWAQ